MTTKGPFAELAAAGTSQSDAAEMNADMVMVTSGSDGSGVILPSRNVNEEVVICNGLTAANIFVYPRSGGKINNASANTPLDLPANRAARFRAINNLEWVAFF